VLLCIAHDPDMRLRDIAARTGITGPTAYSILTDLTEAEYVVKHKDGLSDREDEDQVEEQLQRPDGLCRTTCPPSAVSTGTVVRSSV
jgi:Mn-dependent DtxR family transcriptional regulator